MWDRLWLNARIATMTPGRPYGLIDDGALATEGRRCAWVGERTSLPAPLERCAAEVRDAGGRLIVPGWIDCHTHLVYAGDRAREFELRLEGASYEQIARAGGGILSTVRATRAATFESLLEDADRRVRRMIAAGTTTVEIKSGYGLDLETERKILRVARELGRRHPIDVVTTFLGAHTIPPEFSGDANRYVAFVADQVLPALAAEKLVDAVDVFCERIAFNAEQTERVCERARELGIPIKLHADQLSDSGGAALAARLHALSADHLEHANGAGIAALAHAGTVAVLLPGASYFLRESQKPPLDALRAAGATIALATDCNPGTSPLYSPPLAMNLACTIFGMTCEEALRGFTASAAKALGIEARSGTLAAGMAADFALWDAREPAELAYSIGETRPHAVVKAGRQVSLNGAG
ncbi:MAG: imidazolonepropionase [Candidatus Eremiobacteraeota bacterium]|nr:imidazolonepropionase [Candidatus Eremiobacteraeota bacterium]